MFNKVPVLHITGKSKSTIKDLVVQEHRLIIIVDNREVVTMLCSPENLEFLAVGYLCSEGLITAKNDIKEITLHTTREVIQVVTREPGKLTKDKTFQPIIASSGGKGILTHSSGKYKTKIDTRIDISPSEVFALMDDFIQRSDVHKATGGVHSAALCDTKNITIFREDIGRHNAIDKIFGECILKDIPTNNRIVITSGRVSSEILLKVAKRDIPMLISKSAPTNQGVRLADDLGITLIGFVRGRNMNVYTHTWRMVPDET